MLARPTHLGTQVWQWCKRTSCRLCTCRWLSEANKLCMARTKSAPSLSEMGRFLVWHVGFLSYSGMCAHRQASSFTSATRTAGPKPSPNACRCQRQVKTGIADFGPCFDVPDDSSRTMTTLFQRTAYKITWLSLFVIARMRDTCQRKEPAGAVGSYPILVTGKRNICGEQTASRM